MHAGLRVSVCVLCVLVKKCPVVTMTAGWELSLSG